MQAMQKFSIHERFRIVFLSGLTYFLVDVPVQLTGVLPSFAGIKNFLPFTLGLFFGIYGTAGCVAGCILSALIVNHNFISVLYECFCIIMTGLGMFYGWHILTKKNRILFKTAGDYARYIFLVLVLSGLCCEAAVSLAYLLTGLFIAVPVNILFSSVLYVDPVMPRWCSYKCDVELCLISGAESLEEANEILETEALKHEIGIKRVFELQSCFEELSIRIFNAIPDAKISLHVIYGEAISARLKWPGEKYNPLLIRPNEDEINIMGLKIIKHRALRASFEYSEGNNNVHVVI